VTAWVLWTCITVSTGVSTQGESDSRRVNICRVCQTRVDQYTILRWRRNGKFKSIIPHATWHMASAISQTTAQLRLTSLCRTGTLQFFIFDSKLIREILDRLWAPRHVIIIRTRPYITGTLRSVSWYMTRPHLNYDGIPNLHSANSRQLLGATDNCSGVSRWDRLILAPGHRVGGSPVFREGVRSPTLPVFQSSANWVILDPGSSIPAFMYWDNNAAPLSNAAGKRNWNDDPCRFFGGTVELP